MSAGMSAGERIERFRGSRFVMLFAAFLLVAEAVFVGLILGGERYQGYLEMNAELTGGVLRLFGHETTRESTLITSDRCWFRVIPGCDGVQLFLLYACAVLAFPGRPGAKLLALVVGVVGVFSINLLRLVTLYLTLAYVPDVYDTIHLTVWPLVLMAFVLVLWLFWAMRMTPGASLREARETEA